MRNSGAGGCCSGILRRLLCTGNLPTHPSDGVAEFDNLKTEENEKHGVSIPASAAAETGPGVVARLMGLNSLPDTNWIPKQRSPDAVSRSKSLNFADYALGFDVNQADRGRRHRRVRTSSSFREDTSSLNPINDFLAVVYMKDFEDLSNLRKSEMGVKELKQGSRDEQKDNVKKNLRQQTRDLTKKKENQRKKINISKLKDEPRREIAKKRRPQNGKFNQSEDKVSILPSYKQRPTKNGGTVNSKFAQKKPQTQKEDQSIETNLKKKTKNQNLRNGSKKSEPKFDPENSTDFPDERIPLRKEIDLQKETQKKYRDNDGLEEDGKKKKKKMEDFICEAVERVCMLAEEDVRERDWTVRIKNVYELEEFEELCIELERHVVRVLLIQTLDDLFASSQ